MRREHGLCRVTSELDEARALVLGDREVRMRRQHRTDVAERLGVELRPAEHLDEPHRQVRHVRRGYAREAWAKQHIRLHPRVHRVRESKERLDAADSRVDARRALGSDGRVREVLHRLDRRDERPNVGEKHAKLAELPNLGPTIVQRLGGVGIDDMALLRRAAGLP